MKIIHLSRSVWQLEPPFDNVMHTITHAQCEGQWEMLKKNTSVVMSLEFFLKSKNETKREVCTSAQPENCFPVPASLWRAAPVVHRILSSECLIQLASQ